jgi:competence protein ComEA
MNKFKYVAATLALLSVCFTTSVAVAKTPVNADAGTEVMVQQKLNINTADVAQLTKIKGLGQKKAQAIVTYIKQNGKLSSVGELAKVKGIGDKLVAKVSPYVTVE